MYAFERPPHFSSAALDDIRSTRIRQLHAYWKAKCSDVAPPPRSAIEPAEIRALLPYLILSDLWPDPIRITYRLVGTAVVRWHGRDFTGRSHDDVASLRGSGLDEAYRRMMDTASPIFGRSALEAGDRSWIDFEYALLPLSDDGRTVNKALAIQCTGEAEKAAWPEPPRTLPEAAGLPRVQPGLD